MALTRKSQGGVILIEALIGILIFSIGILALIGMQAAAMKNTTDARYRSEAAYLANQIIGQMWVDRTNLAQYDDAIAAYGLRDQWRLQVAATLPGVDPAAIPPTLVPSILVPAASNNKVTVVVRWRQPGDPPGNAPRQVQMINWIN